MQLVIIAGGLGTRLRPLTLHRPKALLPLVDRPQIAHILDALPASCDEVIVAVNYMFEQVRDFFRMRRFGVEVRVVDEPMPLGTAGAIKNVQRHLHGPFAVYNGDVVDTIDFDRLVKAHERGGGIGTIAVWPMADVSAYGVVAIEKGRVVQFIEKPAKGEAPSNLVNAGRYVFEPDVFDFIEAGRAKISGDADITSGHLRPPVYAGPGTFVEGRVGPYVVLGKACRIGRATVRNATLLEGVSVDDKADVVDSIAGAGAAIGEGAHVRDSILADGAQVPPHATVVDERVTA